MALEKLISLCGEYKELQRMQEELAAEMEAIKEAIRSAMGEDDAITAGPYKVTNKLVTSSRIDSTAFKKALPELAAQFTKSTQARRFVIS